MMSHKNGMTHCAPACSKSKPQAESACKTLVRRRCRAHSTRSRRRQTLADFVRRRGRRLIVAAPSRLNLELCLQTRPALCSPKAQIGPLLSIGSREFMARREPLPQSAPARWAQRVSDGNVLVSGAISTCGNQSQHFIRPASPRARLLEGAARWSCWIRIALIARSNLGDCSVCLSKVPSAECRRPAGFSWLKSGASFNLTPPTRGYRACTAAAKSEVSGGQQAVWLVSFWFVCVASRALERRRKTRRQDDAPPARHSPGLCNFLNKGRICNSPS